MRLFLKKWVFMGPWTWIFTFLDYTIPKKDNLVLFGSHDGLKFSSNSAALFSHCANHKLLINPVWITRSKACYNEVERKFPGRVVYSLSLSGVWTYLRCKRVVISHSYIDMSLMPLTPKKTVYYVWHALHFAKPRLEYDDNHHYDLWNRRVDYFFTYAEIERDIMAPFLNDSCEFIVTGYPVLDRVLRKLNNNQTNRIEEPEKTKTILYAPHSRSGNSKSNITSEDFTIIHPDLSHDEIGSFLEQNNLNLIIRPHPSTSIEKTSISNTIYSSIQDEPNIHDLFFRIDLLITDYSSVQFDWLLFDKPVILSLYDVEDFLMPQFGGFSRPLQDLASGHVCKTKNEVLAAIVEALDSDPYSRKRGEMKKALHPKTDGKAAERISNIIESHIRGEID